MAMFGRAKKLAALALLPLLTVGSAWAVDLKEGVESVFSPLVIESIKDSGSRGEVTLRAPARMPDYFESGDKANKAFAIDSARIFRDVETLDRLLLKVPKGGEVHSMDISRAAIEKHYGVSFSEMRGDPSAWRSKFAQQYDNKQSRAEFVEKFVTKE